MAAKVLVTGGSGFIGTHILQQLITEGYDIVAVVRSEEKGQRLASQFDNKLSFAVVKDITAPGAFDKVLTQTPGLRYVIHSASPFIYGHSDPETEILQPAIQGSIRILESVLKHAPSVEQVVLTSSLASMVGDPSADPVVNETHWNPITYEQSLEAENTYIGSKKLAEKAAWDFMSDHPEARFSLTTINPAFVFGPLLFPSKSGDTVNTSNQAIDELIRGFHPEKVPEGIVPIWVDVRDVASAHVRAIQKEAARSGRFIVANDLFTMDEVVQIMHDDFPQLRDRLPKPQDTKKAPLQIDNSRSRQILGIECHSLKECIRSTTQSLMMKNGLI